MLVLPHNATVDTLGRSDERKGIQARFSAKFETALWAASLAVALLVPNGYPQLVAFSVLSLCSLAWIARVCHRD